MEQTPEIYPQRQSGPSPVVQLVQFAILALATVLFVIGYVSNGLYVVKSESSEYSVNDGLWYSTRCNYRGECETNSMKELNEIGTISDYQYMDIVGRQVCLTLALCCIFMAGLLYLLGLCRQLPDHKMRIGAISCFLIPVVFLSVFCGREGRRQHIISKDEDYNKIVFPWSIACLGISDILIVISTCICIYMYITDLRQENQSKESSILSNNRTVNAFKIEVSICLLSVLLQIVGYFSNALYIAKDFNDEEQKIGIWYMTICRNVTTSKDCETKSRAQQVEDLRKEGANGDLTENVIIGTQVIMTLALICAFFAVVLYFLGLCNRIDRRWMRFGVLVSSILSGTFVIHLCGFEARYQHLLSENMLYTMYFPWGLFTSGLGGVLILISAGICFIVLFFLQKKNAPQQTEFRMM